MQITFRNEEEKGYDIEITVDENNVANIQVQMINIAEEEMPEGKIQSKLFDPYGFGLDILQLVRSKIAIPKAEEKEDIRAKFEASLREKEEEVVSREKAASIREGFEEYEKTVAEAEKITGDRESAEGLAQEWIRAKNRVKAVADSGIPVEEYAKILEERRNTDTVVNQTSRSDTRNSIRLADNKSLVNELFIDIAYYGLGKIDRRTFVEYIKEFAYCRKQIADKSINRSDSVHAAVYKFALGESTAEEFITYVYNAINSRRQPNSKVIKPSIIKNFFKRLVNAAIAALKVLVEE